MFHTLKLDKFITQGTRNKELRNKETISQLKPFFNQPHSNMHTTLPLPDGASAQYLYQLKYSLQQANAEPGACLGKMKCQAVKRAEPKPLCASQPKQCFPKERGTETNAI